MRKLFTIVVAVLLTASVFAQSPEKMSYQAVIRDANDVLITNTQIGMQISILQGSTSGTAVYVETQEPSTNANGLGSIEIGTGTVVSGDFTTIDWANGTYFIKTETDPDGATGGIAYTITGTSQLLSVPYALHAKNADTVTGGITETDPTYTSSQAANITATDITNLGNLSGTNTGDQDGSETKVTAGTNVTVTGSGTTVSPYVINASSGSSSHYIGELYGGGVVFWVDQTGQHGLIASMIDLSTSQAWSNVSSSLIGPTAQSDWDGLSNSNAIVGQATHSSSAAQLCLDYTNADYGTGTYSDWYLPSRGELNDLWNNIKAVQKALDSDGNATTTAMAKNYYWSSSEDDSNNAWDFNFYNGLTYNDGKDDTGYVRAVRAF